MDFDNFVLMGGSNGEVMAGGYIINSRLLVPSMSGGKNKNKKDKEEEVCEPWCPTFRIVLCSFSGSFSFKIIPSVLVVASPVSIKEKSP